MCAAQGLNCRWTSVPTMAPMSAVKGQGLASLLESSALRVSAGEGSEARRQRLWVVPVEACRGALLWRNGSTVLPTLQQWLLTLCFLCACSRIRPAAALRASAGDSLHRGPASAHVVLCCRRELPGQLSPLSQLALRPSAPAAVLLPNPQPGASRLQA